MKKIVILFLSVILTMNCVNLAAQANAPTNFKATIGGISLACYLSWTNPATNIAGKPLNSIILIIIERNGEFVTAIENPAVGASMNYTDSEIPGVEAYEYDVYAFTEEGEGEKAYATANIHGTLCNFRFVLEDYDGFGWFPSAGIGITVDGVNYGFLKLAWGSAYAEEIVSLPSGEVEVSWFGSFPDSYHIDVYNSLEELIYTSPSLLNGGVFLAYHNECIECVPITDLEGEYISETDQVNLSWKAPEGDELIGFDIYRNDELIEHLSPLTTFYSENTEKLEDGDYTYCVIPVYPSICTLDDQCFEVNINVGVKDYENSISIYPNPAHSIISIAGAEIVNIKVFNKIGQLISTQHNTNIINVSSLTNGIYLLTIETSTGQIIQKKIIINH